MDDSMVAGDTSDVEAPTTSVDLSLAQIQLEEKDADSEEKEEEDDGDEELRNLPLYGYQLFVLSQYGRPIFVSSGQEDKLCALFALIGVFVSRVKSWNDTLHSFSSGDVHVHFSYRNPLILAAVSKRGEWLSAQLDALFDQILSTLSRTQLESIYEKRGDNFDLRRLIRGTDKYMKSCGSSWRSDPALYLSAMRIFPLAASERETLSTLLATSISANKIEGLIFGVIIAHRQLVTIVRYKKFIMHQKDVHILINLVSTSQSLREADTYTPICLPHFNDTGFLHALISFPWEGLDLCVILLNSKRDQFTPTNEALGDFVSRVNASTSLLSTLTKSLESPVTFDISQIGVGHEHLWHFVYKNRRSHQLCLSGARVPYISLDERRLVNRSVIEASFLVNSSPLLRTSFIRRKHDSILICCADRFELYCILSPLVSAAAANLLADKLHKQLRSLEPRYFMSHLTSF